MDKNDMFTMLCKVDKMQGILLAAYELGQYGSIIQGNDMNGSTEKKMVVFDLLRTHRTCGTLLDVLIDELDELRTMLE